MSGDGFVIRECLVIRPGDSLIIRLDSSVSRDACDEFTDLVRADIRERLPGIDQVLVLGGGVEEIAVYRPETVSVEIGCGGSAVSDQLRETIRRAVRADGSDSAGL